MNRKRVALVVYVDLDPIPGALHTPESAQSYVSSTLKEFFGPYDPGVIIAPSHMQPGTEEENIYTSALADFRRIHQGSITPGWESKVTNAAWRLATSLSKVKTEGREVMDKLVGQRLILDTNKYNLQRREGVYNNALVSDTDTTEGTNPA